MLALALPLTLIAAAGLETFTVNGVPVDVYTPKSAVVADVLVLPGWDSNRTDWCKHGGLCDEADKRGLRLVMPEMGKSVYAWARFPETAAWARTPPTRAELDAVLDVLRRDHGLLADPHKSVIIGRSTGGRGAVLLALDHPEAFAAVASFSGDFDQTQMPKDALMRGAYGAFEKFPERWHGTDNPRERIAELKVPLYLGHAAHDPVVPVSQSVALAAELARAHAPLLIALHVDNEVRAGAHTHAYWRTELPLFFDAVLPGLASATAPQP